MRFSFVFSLIFKIQTIFPHTSILVLDWCTSERWKASRAAQSVYWCWYGSRLVYLRTLKSFLGSPIRLDGVVLDYNGLVPSLSSRFIFQKLLLRISFLYFPEWSEFFSFNKYLLDWRFCTSSPSKILVFLSLRSPSCVKIVLFCGAE